MAANRLFSWMLGRARADWVGEHSTYGQSVFDTKTLRHIYVSCCEKQLHMQTERTACSNCLDNCLDAPMQLEFMLFRTVPKVISVS